MAMEKPRRKSKRLSAFNLRLRDVVRAGDLRELFSLYSEAQNDRDKAHVCGQLAFHTALEHEDRELSEFFLRQARYHAADNFKTLSWLRIMSDLMEQALTDPMFRYRAFEHLNQYRS